MRMYTMVHVYTVCTFHIMFLHKENKINWNARIATFLLTMCKYGDTFSKKKEKNCLISRLENQNRILSSTS